MTTILIAVDETEVSVRAMRRATELFGTGAKYLVMNVASVPTPWVTAGYAYGTTAVWSPQEQAQLLAEAGEASSATVDHAMSEAHMEGAEPLTEVGDAVTAILRSAAEHHADVVVVGSHHKGFMQRLFVGSVSEDLVRSADLPVLVVP
ncbi:MAG: universal stress protein [Actinomycetota bacterium]|nr:universal stress protein [Actinomycetota bacterium]